MKKVFFNTFLLVFALLIAGGCASTNIDSNMDSKSGMEDFNFDGSYNKVWDAVLTSASELNWDILSANKNTGLIQFKDSYVYSPSERNYTRTYSVPTQEKLQKSDVIPYVAGLADIQNEDKSQRFTKESLQINVSEIDSMNSSVDIDYNISAVGKDGVYEKLSTKGSFENKLYSRIETILGGIEEVDTVISRDIFSESIGLYDIFFDFNSYQIREDAKPVLAQNAEIIKADPELNVIIFSYADTRGSDRYNDLLATKRSIATKRYLVKQGIDPDRLITLTRGETSKFAFGETENQYQLNRRSHLIAIKATAPPLEIVN